MFMKSPPAPKKVQFLEDSSVGKNKPGALDEGLEVDPSTPAHQQFD